MSSVTLPSESAPLPQRSRGHVEIGFGLNGLEVLRQEGCGRCLLPDPFGGVPAAVVVNTAGGLTGDDRFGVSASVSAGAALTLTTQAAERIYRSNGGPALVTNRAVLGAGARLHWLPQETILFEQAALARKLEVEMSEDAHFLGLEMLVMGRRAMGETLTRGHITDNWRIRRGGRLLHAEALRLAGEIDRLSARPALLDRARALATLVLVQPGAEALLDTARRLLGSGDVRAAASAWDGRLVVRFLAGDLMPLKVALKRFLTGFPGLSVPRVWQV